MAKAMTKRRILTALCPCLLLLMSACATNKGTTGQNASAETAMVVDTPWGPRLVPNPRAGVRPEAEAQMFAGNGGSEKTTQPSGKVSTVTIHEEGEDGNQ